MPTPHVLCWAFAVEGDRSRVGEGKSGVGHEFRIPRHVKGALVRGAQDLTGALQRGDAAALFHQALKPLHGQVLGLLLVKPLWHADVVTWLSAAQRTVREYFLLTKYSENPLAFVEVVACAELEYPFPVRPDSLRSSCPSLFSRLRYFLQHVLGASEPRTGID